MLDTWNTKTFVMVGPPKDKELQKGQKVSVKISVLCTNKCPGAIFQIWFYAGPVGKEKEIFKICDGVPGTDPAPRALDFSYTVPDDKCGAIEFGWGQEMQYSWADAMENFKGKGYTDNNLGVMLIEGSKPMW